MYLFIHPNFELFRQPNRIPQTGLLTNNINLFFTVLESGKSNINVLADVLSGKGLFPGSQIASCLLAMSSHSGRDKEALWGVLYKNSNHFPKVQPPNPIRLGIMFQQINQEGDTNIQSITQLIPQDIIGILQSMFI